MKNLSLMSVYCLALLLSACGGGSQNSSKEKADDKFTKDSTNNFCVTLPAELAGMKQIADFDKNGDGCLNKEEFNALNKKAREDAKKAQAKAEAETKARTVTAEQSDIQNNSTEFPQIQLLSVLGSEPFVTESGAKHAILNSSKKDAYFYIYFKFDRNLKLDSSNNKQESIWIGIGPNASSDISGNKVASQYINITKYSKSKGGSKQTYLCIYANEGSQKEYGCVSARKYLPKTMVIPSNANLFLLMCQGADASMRCDNHANIKLKLK